jgi:phosphatidylserine/phosphatidylglycerophosphate/cardiolipin synthase-like enzyme
MKENIATLALLAVLALGVKHADATEIKWVCYSPNGGCTDRIIETINACRDPIYIAAYSFTSKPIIDALIEKNKVIPVRLVLDKSNRTGKGSGLTAVKAAGIPTKIDDKHAITHDKYIVCGDTVETGSFNFTNNAEHSNAENALAIRDDHLAQTYRINWQKLWTESADK